MAVTVRLLRLRYGFDPFLLNGRGICLFVDSDVGGCGSYIRILVTFISNGIYCIHTSGYMEYFWTRCRNDIFPDFAD